MMLENCQRCSNSYPQTEVQSKSACNCMDYYQIWHSNTPFFAVCRNISNNYFCWNRVQFLWTSNPALWVRYEKSSCMHEIGVFDPQVQKLGRLSCALRKIKMRITCFSQKNSDLLSLTTSPASPTFLKPQVSCIVVLVYTQSCALRETTGSSLQPRISGHRCKT